jgi:hypothetical protein
MAEQRAIDIAAYEEKIKRLEHERIKLARMDSSSSAAQELKTKIEQAEADVQESEANIQQQENTIKKKIKSQSPTIMFNEAVQHTNFSPGSYIKSRDWAKKHPEVWVALAKVGIR